MCFWLQAAAAGSKFLRWVLDLKSEENSVFEYYDTT